MALNLNETWNDEQLKNVRAFIQEQLKKGFVDVTTQTNVNGKVVLTFTKADGTKVTASFIAAEGSASDGLSNSLYLTAQQKIYAKNTDISFTYTYEQMLDGDVVLDIIPTIEFNVYALTDTNDLGKLLYTKTANAIGTNKVTIPYSELQGSEGRIAIKATASATWQGDTVSTEKTLIVTIASCELSFDESFDLTKQIKGYGVGGTLRQAYVKYIGTQDSELQVYIDGVLRKHIPATNGETVEITYDMATLDETTQETILSEGMHTMQVIAKMDTGTVDNDGLPLYLFSKSLVFDFYKGLTGNHVGIQAVVDTSEVISDPINNFTYNAQQYLTSIIQYAACTYDSDNSTADNPAYLDATAITLSKNNQVINNFSVSPNNTFEHSFRETSLDGYVLEFGVVANNRKIKINIIENASGVKVANGALIDISAQGRSNLENDINRSKWTFTDSDGKKYDSILTDFSFRKKLSSDSDEVDVDGWYDNALNFKGNSTLNIPYTPFKAFKYLEFNIKVDSVLDSDTNILSCLNANGTGGFYIKPEEAGIITNNNLKVSTPIAAGKAYNVGFLLKSYSGNANGTETTTTLLELYVNGIRSGVLVFPNQGDGFDNTATITCNGLGAIWKLYGMRVYNKTLNFVEIYNNYLTTLLDASEIIRLSTENAILTTDKSKISYSALLEKKKNVLVIEVGNGTEKAGLDASTLVSVMDDGKQTIHDGTGAITCATKNLFLDPTAKKKTNFIVKSLTYYNNGSLKDPFSFKTGPTLMQVQGTSSTYYSRKNYDIFFTGQKYAKSDNAKKWTSSFDTTVGSFGDTGAITGANTTKPMYKMSAEDQGVPCLCLKADYSDSSNLHNTYLTKLINDVWFALGGEYLTPPQHNNDTYFDNIRTGINGHGIDVFINDNGEYTYIGKYNMDNEKKDSHHVFGFEGQSERLGNCLCIEFLENNTTATLFNAGEDAAFWETCSDTVDGDGEAVYQLEFRYPGCDWVEATAEQKAAASRPFKWVKACYDDWESKLDENGVSTSNKFVEELTQYFNPKNLVSWYLYTEYFLAVDQRSKNMMLASWGATDTSGVWYFLPYDGDTALGVTNNGYLVLPWDSDENTKNPIDTTQYAYMGHDSNLWKLVRYYLYDDTYTKVASYGLAGCSMQEIAQVLRDEGDGRLNLRFNMNSISEYLNKGRKYWADMIYNFDSETKYIAPLTNQTLQGSQPAFAQFVQGARDAHRDWLIDKRFRMLDSKYAAGFFVKDRQQIYMTTENVEKTLNFKVSAINTSYVQFIKNTASLATKKLNPDEETNISFNASLGTNDPFIMLGFSAVDYLDFDTAAPYASTGLKFAYPALKTLIMDCPAKDGAASSEQFSQGFVEGCPNLRKLVAKGYYQGSGGVLNLANNIMLQHVEIDIPGLKNIILPYSTFNLTYLNVGSLNELIPWEFWDKLNDYYYKKSKSCIVVGELVKPASGTATYYFKDSWKSANYMVSDTHFVSILPVPALYGAGRDNTNSGFFGGTIAARKVSNLKKIIYAKIDTKLVAENNIDTSSAINVLQSMFRECTNLEYVNTKGWRVNQSDFSTSYLTSTNTTVYMFYNSGLTNIDLSFVTFGSVYNNANSAMFYTASDTRTFENSKLTHIKYGAGWFNATVLGLQKTYICTNAGLDAETFVEMANDIPDITALNISNDLKTLNFGTILYNDTTKIPSNVRKQITDKGWIINV